MNMNINISKTYATVKYSMSEIKVSGVRTFNGGQHRVCRWIILVYPLHSADASYNNAYAMIVKKERLFTKMFTKSVHT